MQAFHVSASARGVIVFADGHGQARQKAKKLLGVVAAQIETSRRLLWADPYLTPDNIPASEYLSHGIPLQCPWCGTTIIKEAPKTITNGPSMFCDRSCKATYDARQESIAAATERWFGIEIMSADGIGPARQVTFTFPGGRSYVVWNYGSGALDICTSDQAAWMRWNRYCERQRAKRGVPSLQSSHAGSL